MIVFAFQEGWLSAPLGYEGPEAVEVSSLVFLFGVTFGLATDYAVLVISRIKEQHDRGLANEDAVAIGIGRTGPGGRGGTTASTNVQLTLMRSTTKTSVSSGPMTPPPAPCLP